MRLSIFFLVFISLLFSCQNQPAKVDVEPEKRLSEDEVRDLIFDNVFTADNLRTQEFSIKADRDTLIETENGTILRIYGNCFEDEAGGLASGDVDIEIKEAFDPFDMVNANLTTMSDEGPLMSGGMIYINATSNGKQLQLAENKEIGLMVPDKAMDPDMNVYEGEESEEGIVWKEPEPVMNEKIEEIEHSWRVVTYYHHNDEKTTLEEERQITDWLWQRGRKAGDKKQFGEASIEVLSFSEDKSVLKKMANGVFMQEVITEKGRNGFVEDYNTNYIFSVKKLGWANIDRLFSDPRTQEVDFLVNVDNQKDFSYVYTTLILPNQKMHIPGYQKKDNSFCFSHGDEEKMSLPIGETAMILATAYKGDQPYFALYNVKVTPKMNINFELEEISIDDLKKKLEAQI